MSSSPSHREVERKVRVPEDFALPSFDDIAGDGSVRTLPPVDLVATYHDTTSLALLRWGVTLRRREGGKDEGWHLKLPVPGKDAGTRDEVHAPLSKGTVGAVPAIFVDIVSPLVRDDDIVPLAVVSTHRTATEILDASGRVRVEIVDDHVRITKAGAHVGSFHEIEVELIDAEDKAAERMLDQVVALLLKQGGTPSTVSKAAGALGPQAQLPPDVPDVPMPDRHGLAVDAIRAVLARHVRHLILADVAVRRDLPDSVHQMRVAARRIRSTLSTFETLLQTESTEYLREELSWLASELGAIRDTEVLKERLDASAREIGNERGGKAAAALDSQLDSRMAAARSSAIAALRSDRHVELLTDLIAAVAKPPVTDGAYVRCDKVLPDLLHKAWKDFAKKASRLELDTPAHEWHRTRIRAKRARYAAEAMSDILGKQVTALASSLADVTEVLGNHQDADVAMQVIESMIANVDGPTGFELGVLHEFEGDEQILERLRFFEVWPKVLKRARQAGMHP